MMSVSAPGFRRRLTGLLVTALLAGCASTPGTDDEQAGSGVSDPLESFNRGVYAFNTAADKVTTKPLARGYGKITPTIARRGVSNFFDNLVAPRSAINNFLQGKPARGFNEIGRFVFNSTLGVGGLVDVASAGGMETYDEDFSQTFAVWGLPEGPYVMLPFFGPQTMLAVASLPLDFVTDLRFHIDDTGTRDRLRVLRIVDLRYRLLPADALLDDSSDPYITLRESYLQNREYQIYDGDPPIDDDYYEFFDEDEL